MSAGLIAIIILGIVLVIGIAIYNRLVALRQRVRRSLGDIDAQLTMRHELIPNLVETVKGYAAHEREAFEAVIDARARAMAASGPAAKAAAEGELSQSLRGLFALAEQYPDLKASANFQSLQNQLANVEEMIAAARRASNSATADYNSAIESFPAMLFARPLGFAPAGFHEIAKPDRSVVSAPPAVRF